MQYKWVALGVTTVGMLMAGIDTRIAIIGLPTIATQLGADVEQVIWVSQAYLLAVGAVLLLMGRFADLIGRVKIYNYGFVIFTIGSAFSSISFTPLELIVSRALQGAGGGMIVFNAAAILTDAAPPKELGTILGMNEMAFRMGSVAGLTLSGVILTFLDWRALFYVNIPIGICGTILAHAKLREISKRDAGKKMDWRGYFSFIGGLLLVLLAITFLGYGESNLGLSVSMLCGGAILLIIFVRIEMRSLAPLLDLRLFKIREFAGGNLAQMFNGLAWFGALILVSFYLQIVLGLSPLQAGLSILPLEVTYSALVIVSGKLSDKYGARLFATLGIVISSAGFFYLAASAHAMNYGTIAIALLVLGAGNGMFFPPNISSIMGSVPPNRRGVASGFRATTWNVGVTSSAGIATLLITLGIPYGMFTSLVDNTLPQLAAQQAKGLFVNGFTIAIFVLAVLNALAIVPSALRGSKNSVREEELAFSSSQVDPK